MCKVQIASSSYQSYYWAKHGNFGKGYSQCTVQIASVALETCDPFLGISERCKQPVNSQSVCCCDCVEGIDWSTFNFLSTPLTAQLVCASDWPAVISLNFLSAPSAHRLLPCWYHGEWRNRGKRKLYQQNVTRKRSLAHVNKLQPGVHYMEIEARRRIRLCGSGSRSFSTPSLLEFFNCSCLFRPIKKRSFNLLCVLDLLFRTLAVNSVSDLLLLLFVCFCFSPDVILCGWLGLKHQLTN